MPIDPTPYAPRFEELAVVFFPARLIAEHLVLLPVQKLGQLRDLPFALQAIEANVR